MPKKSTLKKARADKRAGQSASTQAGEFVKEEIDEIRAGKHGVANAKQAIAIGLSKARKAGVDVGQNPNRKTKRKTKAKTPKRGAAGESTAKRRRASTAALKKKSGAGASHRALSRQAKSAAKSRRTRSGR